MKIESFGATDVGLVRLNNEDVFAELLSPPFFILADGMGGHQAGEIAAAETVSFLCKLVKKAGSKTHTADEWVEILEKGIKQANQLIFTLASEDKAKEGMGTTLCLCLVEGETLICGHVGDSRVYRVRKGRITQLTRDHSLKDEMLNAGQLDESRPMRFPYRNVITRAIGTQKNVLPDIQILEIKDGDVYFLCSDGLTESLSDKEILSCIQTTSTLPKAGEKLIREAKKVGGEDNITILLFQIIPQSG